MHNETREQVFRIPGPREGMSLFLRLLPTEQPKTGKSRAVLYVHGATFPSALSIAYRFGGRSWRDELCSAGFDAWGLDFYGFGGSDRYPEMEQPADQHAPLCTAVDAAEQLECAVNFILTHQQINSVSLISHSWGAMPSGILATKHPAVVDRWVLFAPITKRAARRYATPAALPAWRLISAEDQWNRFVEDVPEHEPPVLSRVEFEAWAATYLDADPESRSRSPPSVQTPTGPFSEIIKAWHGVLPWDPAAVQAPVAIIRGEWDGLVTDEDAGWLYRAFAKSPNKRDIKISRGTHLMHLETMRRALWRESVSFLLGDDVAPLPVR